jgi:hypothetical protein
VKETDWEAAKMSLNHFEMKLDRPGNDCAHTVVAERLLKRNQSRLKDLKGRTSPSGLPIHLMRKTVDVSTWTS